MDYGVGNGQMHQVQLQDKIGALNCMHDQQIILRGGTPKIWILLLEGLLRWNVKDCKDFQIIGLILEIGLTAMAKLIKQLILQDIKHLATA